MSTFVAKYDGVCSLCGLSIKKGEDCHFVDHKIAHDTCHKPDGSDFGWERDSVNEAAYSVSGRRNHEKRCETCFLTHAGECL